MYKHIKYPYISILIYILLHARHLLHVCMHVRTYVCTCICTCVCTIYIYTNTYICLYWSILIYIYLACVIFKRTNIFIPAKTLTHAHAQRHKQPYRHANTDTHAHAYRHNQQGRNLDQESSLAQCYWSIWLHNRPGTVCACCSVLQFIAVCCTVWLIDLASYLLISWICIYADIYAHTYRICIYIYIWAPTYEKDMRSQAKESWILIFIYTNKIRIGNIYVYKYFYWLVRSQVKQSWLLICICMYI